MDVQGKAAIVTGGGTGVGRATAIALGRLGCSVLVNYSKSKAGAEETAAAVEAAGARAVAVRADVARDEDCRQMVETALAELGRLDVVINNAGTTRFIAHTDLEAVTEEVWDEIFSVNLRGAFQVARAARPALADSGNGEIVNVASVAGVVGVGSSVPYCASKAALINLTMTLARVFAPNTRVNAVAPGFIDGEWLQQGFGDAFEDIKQMYCDRAALQSVCTPTDVADAILGLVTGSDKVTGQCIVCDAGAILGPGG